MNDGLDDHYEALLREAARRLVDALTPYGALARAKLAELSGAPRWSTIDFGAALRWAVDHNYLRRLGGDWYEVGPEANRDEGEHLVVEGGW